ncbi:M20 family metallopeptidase [Paracoccus aminophilus]|uniref:Acetylornithine deacetylase/succinyl-diaminopimelate desuccinylase n=1 Tax=Paracoccus aminophilus JCM 7686 TaxID=1367847 RepID=S5YZY7_PARAH|nr:M20/M25/M40 family metallo-hydrolase [Paracoccus aminophilus]AGT10771.1 acetylornithine deacetylase/succinyl-diaminopimelate desuccinylase [Paracoccus aminophilus JCM 7686]
MDRKALLDSLDEKACLDFVSMMVKHKTYSETEGETVLVKRMVEEMAAIGLEAEIRPFGDKGRSNGVGTFRGTGGGKSLMFNGHLDTNPATEGWTVDPWGGLVDDRFIYGIGVSNMKSSDAAYFCAVRALKAAGVKLKGDVILTYVVGELQGGVGTEALLREGLRADYFVNCEPSDLVAVTMHAAALKFQIELTGDTRHLSKREEAVDALAAGCDLVPRLNAMTFKGALSPEHASVNRCHVGVFKGALGRDLEEWRPPQVADFCVLKGSARYAPGQSREGVLADMEEELAALRDRFPGLRTKLISMDTMEEKGLSLMPPYEVNRDSAIVAAINAAYLEVRGEAQPTGAITPTRFYGSDAGHLYELGGMEGIVCGCGGRYNTMPDERVDIVDYIDMIKVYMLTILNICGVEEAA